MKKKISAIILIGFLLILPLILLIIDSYTNINNTNNDIEISFNTTKDKIHATKAITEHEKRKGLMYIHELKPNEGMLFIYEESKLLSFWMKNTYIPLDIIFINEDKTIDTIYKNTKPLDKETLYKSSDPVKYVLEINANKSDELNLRVGDQINFSL